MVLSFEYGEAKAAIARWLSSLDGLNWEELPYYQHFGGPFGRQQYYLAADRMLANPSQPMTDWQEEILRRYGPLPQGVTQ